MIESIYDADDTASDTLVSDIAVSVAKMTRDIKNTMGMLTPDQARYFVTMYYDIQSGRVAANNRAIKLGKTEQPHDALDYLTAQHQVLETQIKNGLDVYSMNHPVGVWMRSIKGVGPVIASGIIAHIQDINRFNTVGALWAYSGFDPARGKRVKGQKMTHNPSLKKIAWHMGQCAKRLSPDKENPANSPYYRRLYDERKEYETAKNLKGDYAEQAARILKEKDWSRDTVTKAIYESGMLPPAHIDARACRYVAKMFLSHVHRVWWLQNHPGETPLEIYPLAHLKHSTYIDPPNWPMMDGVTSV